MDNTPPRDGLLSIIFVADNGNRGTYELWHKVLKNHSVRWYWRALGNEGEEASAWEATHAARNWIRDGVHSTAATSIHQSNKRQGE